MGLGYRDIAAEFVRRYSLRPRRDVDQFAAQIGMAS
jgi:hypothetical protein